MRTEIASAIGRDGFATIPEVVPPETIARVVEGLGDDGRHAIRNLIAEVPAVAELCRSGPVRELVEAVLGPACFAVRGILFDKTPGANWKVAWHQDLTIAVRQPREVAGFGPWSEKAGIPHVQPPAAILGRMVALRVHIDACGAENGPLRVLPGTHRDGRLDPEAIARHRARVAEVVCAVDRGGVVMMRPLLLHASSTAEVPGHRRVVHLEFAAEDLPGGLEWHERW
jgi:ectoine hydroxylase-related dioxygenase (phytanoyl-CoA dioxygenase family)